MLLRGERRCLSRRSSSQVASRLVKMPAGSQKNSCCQMRCCSGKVEDQVTMPEPSSGMRWIR